MKIIVYLPDNHKEERLYTVDYVFSFLGIEYECKFSEDVCSSSVCFNNKRLVVEDCFWNKFPEGLDYLKIESLPKVYYGKNDFTIEDDIPILYGKNNICITESEIVCGLDIFSSIFFMLSRWEEYVVNVRDNHGRFPAKESIAYKYNFLHRPIVNEYIEFFWKLILYLGYCGNRKKREFDLNLTHDIDSFRIKNKFYFLTKEILMGFIKKRPINYKSYFKSFFIDSYNSFDFLMRSSEKYNRYSHFYFMSADPRIDKNLQSVWLKKRKFKNTIEELMKRGHIVGFHPGYFTQNNSSQFHYEMEELNRIAQISVKEGRQHYLKIELPESMRILNNEKMEIDSSLGYADFDGFRCGTGDTFPYFDFINRKRLSICEMPLVIMDSTLLNYRNLDMERFKNTVMNYVNIGKKYNMPITLLIHNSTFLHYPALKKVYTKILGETFQ